jgi:hypothetical protein
MEKRMNLQLFAEDGTGADANGAGQRQEQHNDPTPGAASPAAQPKPSPTFDDMLREPGYQAEFDRRVAKAIETAKQKFADPRVDGLQKQLDGYMRREAVIKADVDPKFARFVTSEVTEAMAEGESFEEKLEAYLKDNPQYLRAAEPEPGKAWGRRMQGGDDGGADGVEAAFKALNPSLKID